uniref:Uncharacterized protein n=1 Tax=Cacopsylla melanoneura TaxID=428564 RepID=A0A8D8VSI6_9HEMI
MLNGIINFTLMLASTILHYDFDAGINLPLQFSSWHQFYITMNIAPISKKKVYSIFSKNKIPFYSTWEYSRDVGMPLLLAFISPACVPNIILASCVLVCVCVCVCVCVNRISRER